MISLSFEFYKTSITKHGKLVRRFQGPADSYCIFKDAIILESFEKNKKEY